MEARGWLIENNVDGVAVLEMGGSGVTIGYALGSKRPISTDARHLKMLSRQLSHLSCTTRDATCLRDVHLLFIELFSAPHPRLARLSSQNNIKTRGQHREREATKESHRAGPRVPPVLRRVFPPFRFVCFLGILSIQTTDHLAPFKRLARGHLSPFFPLSFSRTRT